MNIISDLIAYCVEWSLKKPNLRNIVMLEELEWKVGGKVKENPVLIKEVITML